jgi:nucleotide-binding universal stress UspA family protein
MTFTKILCPIDFSPGAGSAQRVAVRLAAESNAELVLVHAWHIPPTAFSLDAPFPAQVVQQIADDSQRALDAAVRGAVAAGVHHVTGKLLNGVPWTQIIDQLEQQAFDLCVVGTHGRTGLRRILLGSVAEKVVRHAPCSVLVVRPDSEAKPFTHVLIPTDFSADARHAIELAPKLVAPQGALTLLHVIEVPATYTSDLPTAEIARELDQRAKTAVADAAARLSTIATTPVATRIRVGAPGAQTLAVIEDDPAIDLVVMGSHGRTGIKRALMGSVAEKVVRHARCPVLVARERA